MNDELTAQVLHQCARLLTADGVKFIRLFYDLTRLIYFYLYKFTRIHKEFHEILYFCFRSIGIIKSHEMFSELKKRVDKGLCNNQPTNN